MKAKRIAAVIVALILASFGVSAHFYAYDYYDVPRYGSTVSSDYSYSRNSESVSVRESESEHSSSSGRAGSYRYATDHYDYGRSREYEFSRESVTESASTSRYYGHGYPFSRYYYDGIDYRYPYYDVGTNYGYDYRPFSDYYEYGPTSPYYDPYRYSRRAYSSRYLPYGYY